MKRGEYLTRLRLKAGLSQNGVAEKLNYSPQLVSLWEKDKSDIDLRIIGKYAKILNVDLKSFILLKDKKTNSNCDEKEFDIEKFASNIKFLRKDKKLLQIDIATKTKTNVKTVGSWESGTSTPTISNFITLCSIYKKSFDELYFAYEDESLREVDKKKKLIPILVPVVIVLAGGTATGITLGATAMNNETSISESSEESSVSSSEVTSSSVHVHLFSSSTIRPTYDSDGSTTYTCEECGYSYIEILPKLEHQYSETYSYNNHYHYHSCIDEGYEDLVIDKAPHDIVIEVEGNVTKYSCSTCDFSYTTEDYVVIVDLLNGDGEPCFSASSKNDMYLKVMNANKYPMTSIGYHLVLKDDPNKFMSGSYSVSNQCLDVPDYTLFVIHHVFFTAASDVIVPGNVIEVTFTTTSMDPDLLSVDSSTFEITITE